MIFVLKGNQDYPKNSYFIEKYETKEEAVKSMNEYYYMQDYIFIEGKELKLTLTEVENENN